jgi:protein TonB
MAEVVVSHVMTARRVSLDVVPTLLVHAQPGGADLAGAQWPILRMEGRTNAPHPDSPAPSAAAHGAGAARSRGNRLSPLHVVAILVSGAAHAGALAIVLGGGPAGPDAGRPADIAVPQAEVTLISQASFDAMVAPQPFVDTTSPDAPIPAAYDTADAGTLTSPDTQPASPAAAMAAAFPAPADSPPAPVLSPPPLAFLSAPAALADLPEAGTSDAPAARPAPPPSPAAAPDAPPAPAPDVPAQADEDPAPKPVTKPPKAKAKRTAAAPPSPARAVASPATGLSGGARKAAMADWGGRLRARIEGAKSYPAGTTAAGKVRLALTVAPSGQVLGVGVAQGSGDPTLDRAAVAAVTRAGRMPKAPDGLAETSYSFTLTVSFAP